MASLDRRSVLRLGGSVFGTTIAGCLDGATDSTSDGNQTADETGATEIGTGVGSTVSDRADRTPDTARPDGESYAPGPRLVLTADVDIEALLTLIELEESTVVYERIHEVESVGTVSLDDQFEPGEDYRFVVTVDGERIFDRLISHYEAYELAIHSLSTVEVVTHVEV